MQSEMILKITGSIECLEGLVDPECSIYSVDPKTGQVPIESIRAERLRREEMLAALQAQHIAPTTT